MNSKPSIFMHSTEVPDTETVAQIQHFLATRGATSVKIEYDEGKVASLAFALRVNDAEVPFRLPCRHKALAALAKRLGKKPKKNETLEDWARRVAWRQILRWVEAQLALIETGMVKAEEVFLPYVIMANNKSMFQAIEEQRFLSLPKAASAGSDRDTPEEDSDAEDS